MKATPLSQSQIDHLMNHARYGDRILVGDMKKSPEKTIWAGLGNASGLHSYADTICKEKYEKRKTTLLNKLNRINLNTDIVYVLIYSNITRDRGRWLIDHKIKK